MRKSKPVSYTEADEDLIKWAAEQPGGFSGTVRTALQNHRLNQTADNLVGPLIDPLAVRLLGPVTDMVLGRVMAKLKVIAMAEQPEQTEEVGGSLQKFAL